MAKIVTFEMYAAAAGALRTAEAQTAENAKERREKVAAMFGTMVAHFSTDKTASVERVLPAMYGAEKWAEYSDSVKKVRRSEVATVYEVTKREPQTASAIVALVTAAKRPFRSTFLQTVTFAKNNPKSPVATLKDRIENPPVDAQSDGDFFEGIIRGATGLFENGSPHFEHVREGVAILQRYYKAQRNAGGLQTSAEIKAAARKAAKNGDVDFATAKLKTA